MSKYLFSWDYLLVFVDSLLVSSTYRSRASGESSCVLYYLIYRRLIVVSRFSHLLPLEYTNKSTTVSARNQSKIDHAS